MMKASEFHPLGDRLLVKPEDAVEVTAGGVHLPSSAQEKPLTGAVVAQGPDVSVGIAGCSILYSKYAGLEVATETGPHIILRLGDVLGTVGQAAF